MGQTKRAKGIPVNKSSVKPTGSQILCNTLVELGVDVVFGLPGGAVLPLYDTLYECSDLRHILVRHEQAAAMAADGYARSSRKVGVCIATSGPGATNLVTGLATAMMDSVPVVAITGQVSRAAIGTDAFQEIDITGVTLSITKHNYLVKNPEDIRRVIKEAFYIASTGRPGPVLVDIPKDVFQAEVDPPVDKVDEIPAIPGYHVASEAPQEQVEKAATMINNAKRPIMLVGRGSIISGAFDGVRELADKADMPVVMSLLGLSAFSSKDPRCLGFPGMHGMAYASLALDEADVLISLGARFDDRIVGDPERFSPNSRKAHVDIDPSEFEKLVKVDLKINADVATFLSQLLPRIKKISRSGWIERTAHIKKEHPLVVDRTKPHSERLLGQEVIRALSKVTSGDALICTGIGQHQMWAAQHYEFTRQNSLIMSGGLGTMGYEVPSAMGVQVANPKSLVWSICGDGGFQMTLMELATIVENKLPIKYLIMNNNHLGMITQWQGMFYSNHHNADEYQANPDFVKLAEAYGVKGYRVTKRDELEKTIMEACAHAGPVVIDCIIEKVDNVYPMIPPGQSVNELIEEPVEL